MSRRGGDCTYSLRLLGTTIFHLVQIGYTYSNIFLDSMSSDFLNFFVDDLKYYML